MKLKTINVEVKRQLDTGRDNRIINEKTEKYWETYINVNPKRLYLAYQDKIRFRGESACNITCAGKTLKIYSFVLKK